MAAGVLHARERLWQMELYRRAASGRLVGGAGRAHAADRQAAADARPARGRGSRMAGRAAGRANGPGAVYRGRERADGAGGRARRSRSNSSCCASNPAPWTPIDSLAVGRLLAWRLAENHTSELVQCGARGRARYRPTRSASTGAYPTSAPTVWASPAPAASPRQARLTTGAGGASLSDANAAPARLEWPRGLEWLEPGARRGLSNNFVVAGSRTTSGRPLLANDPHLQIEFPSVWYEMHLVAAGLDVSGGDDSGRAVRGHRPQRAHRVGRDQHRRRRPGSVSSSDSILRVAAIIYRGQWLPVEITSVDIPVRGRDAEPFEVWRTQHGNVFSEVGLSWDEPPAWLKRNAERSGERRAFALRWEIAGEIVGAFEALNRASNWDEFSAAVQRFSAPSQNFVYADVEGNIGYSMSGVLPHAGSRQRNVPLDGSAGEGEWSGRVNPASLPRAFNPAPGFITSSNNEIDRHWSGHDHARLGGAISRHAAAARRCRRARRSGSATRRSCRTTSRMWPPSACSHGVDRAIDAGRKAGGADDRRSRARTAAQVGSADERAAGRRLVRGVRRRGVAADVHRRMGHRAVCEVLRVGRCGTPGRSVRDRRRAQCAMVRRHRHDRSPRDAGRHLSARRARRA